MFHGLAGIGQPIKQQAMACTVEESGFDSQQRKRFSVLHSVQTRPEAHSASYPMTTGSFFPQGQNDDYSPLYVVKRKVTISL
jgi:hypothetical protein